MSRRRDPGVARAPLFAALGDSTRLELIGRLSLGQPRSISGLAEGSRLTRQAITKHLRILKDVGLVRAERHGREIHYQFVPRPIAEARRFLDRVSSQWEGALGRLKAFVEADQAVNKDP
jgi:DNA-binding transcriptional ArsR family regulator